MTEDFGKYTTQPKLNFSSDFVIDKNLNLPSNFKKKGIVAAEVEDLLDMDGGGANNDRFTVNVPTEIGGAGVDITVRVVTADPSDGTAYEVQVGLSTGVTTRNRLVLAFNGLDSSVVKYGAGSGDVTNGIAGITATNGRTDVELTITADAAGTFGNKIVFTDVEGTMVRDGGASASPASLTGGTDIQTIPFFLNTPGPATLRNRATSYKVER